MHTNTIYPIAETIREKDITLVNLSLLLESICYQHKIEDEEEGNHSIYVNETGLFPFWIRIFERSHVIMLSTYLKMSQDVIVDDALMFKFCNEINTDIILPSVNWKDGCLWMWYPIYIKDEMHKQHFFRLMRYFADGVPKIRRSLKSFLDEQKSMD